MKPEKLIEILGIIATLLIFYLAIKDTITNIIRNEAIAAGVAKWEVNATNGVTTFVYIKK